MKKLMVTMVLVLSLSGLSLAQSYQPNFEFNLFGGYALTSVKGTSTYSDSWSYFLLNNVTESTAIATTSKNAPFFGAGFNYFFSPNFGLGLNFGYLKSTLTTTGAFNYQWTWSDGRSATRTQDWTSDADALTSIPISLNFVAKFGNGPIEGFFEAGPTIYFNEAIINTNIGYGITYYSFPTQYVDAVAIPISGYDLKSGKSTWTGIGGNIGAGVTFMFSPSIGLSLEARYFLNPEREFDWYITPGTYDGIFFTNLKNWDLTADDLAYIKDDNLLTTIKVNPSFFQLQAGIKIRL
jgi:hypothetical protein